MGTLCVKSSDQDALNDSEQQNQQVNHRKVTIKEEEIVIAKLKMQKDRIYQREKGLGKKLALLNEKVKQSIINNDKSTAKYHLQQVKLTQKYINDCRSKQLFVDQNINSLEQTMNDKEFYDTVKMSNQALKKLNEEIDIEEIQIAQELQQENQMNTDHMNEIMTKNDINQEEIENELEQMEVQLIQQNFDVVGDLKIDQKQPTSIQNSEQEPAQVLHQPEAMLN